MTAVKKYANGSITVEAAIAMPVFICAVMSIVFLLKVIYVQELIQHALSETANEIASYSYLYSVSGINQVNNSISSNLEMGHEKIKSQLNTVVQTYDSFTSADEKGIDSISEIEENLNQSTAVIKEIMNNPKQEIRYIAYAFAKEGFEGAKTELMLTPLAKVLLTKYLVDKEQDVDKRLERLDIKGGIDGLDFSGSKFFADRENIILEVKYKIKPNAPIRLVPEIPVVQRVVVRGWLDGDDREAKIDIWSLPAMERGKKLQEIYGRNLPLKFKTITKFKNNKATVITSMDIRLKSYKGKPKTALNEINRAVNDIKKFRSYRTTVEENGKKVEYYINSTMIKEKSVIVIVPKGSITEEFQKVADTARKRASKYGIILEIEEY